jgi:hypothetical protein
MIERERRPTRRSLSLNLSLPTTFAPVGVDAAPTLLPVSGYSMTIFASDFAVRVRKYHRGLDYLA